MAFSTERKRQISGAAGKFTGVEKGSDHLCDNPPYDTVQQKTAKRLGCMWGVACGVCFCCQPLESRSTTGFTHPPQMMNPPGKPGPPIFLRKQPKRTPMVTRQMTVSKVGVRLQYCKMLHQSVSGLSPHA